MPVKSIITYPKSGLTHLLKDKLKIPIMYNKRSLNIASSVAIILSENLRQNKFLNHG